MTQPPGSPAASGPPPRKKLLGRHADLATRYRVYEIPGGLEVQERSFVEIHRRRVFYDEVVLVTYHRFRQPLTIAAAALLGGVPLLIAGAILAAGGSSLAAGVLALLGAPFSALAVLYAAVPWHAVTVHGMRARARLVVRFRARRARDLFARLCREIAAAQRAEAARLAGVRAARQRPDEAPPAPPQTA